MIITDGRTSNRYYELSFKVWITISDYNYNYDYDYNTNIISCIAK